MKAKRTLIAACIAALFASGAVLAKDKWEYHEDGWNKTRSYGSVMIGEDSVDRWGPWEEFVEPAAGAPSIGFLGAGGSDPYNPIPNPIPPVAGCGEGEWCGYIAFGLNYDSRYGYGGGKKGGYHLPPYLNRFVPGEIALQFEQPESGYFGDWWGPGGVNLVLTSDLEGIAGAGSETGMIPSFFFGKQGFFKGFDGNKWNYVKIEGGPNGYNWYTHTWVSDYATMGLLKAKVTEYVYDTYRENGGDGYEEVTTVYAPFVAGQLTPLADMASLASREITASYCGQTALAGGHVSMTVFFYGNPSWNGTFNGGSGPAGFTVAGGAVSGAGFSATTANLSTSGGSISGSVNGSFYGPQAAAAGGVIDVTKTTSYANGVSVQVIAPPPVETTRYVDAFLANKVSQTSGIPK